MSGGFPDMAVLWIEDEGLSQEPPERCTLAEFLAANADYPDECARAIALAVGESMTVGGGSAPMFTIRRIA